MPPVDPGPGIDKPCPLMLGMSCGKGQSNGEDKAPSLDSGKWGRTPKNRAL